MVIYENKQNFQKEKLYARKNNICSNKSFTKITKTFKREKICEMNIWWNNCYKK